MKRIQKLQRLDTLHFTSIGSSSRPVSPIDKLARAFPRLRELTYPTIEAESLADAIPFLESLETLNVGQIRTSLTNDVWPILAQLKKLKHFNIRPSFSDSQLELIRKSLRNVQVQGKSSNRSGSSRRMSRNSQTVLSGIDHKSGIAWAIQNSVLTQISVAQLLFFVGTEDPRLNSVSLHASGLMPEVLAVRF